MQVTATLKNARLINRGDYFVVTGEIYDDVHKRFTNGWEIRTSWVREIRGNLVTTRNSVYAVHWEEGHEPVQDYKRNSEEDV